MTVDWIDARTIWQQGNKARLDHLLQEPIENSPAFTYASLHFPLNQFVFWEDSSRKRIQGWAIAHDTPSTCTWSILRGDLACFKAYLGAIKPGEAAVFEYIRPEERAYFTNIIGVEPGPFAWYYEITADEYHRQSKDPTRFLFHEPCKVHHFDRASARDLILFQGYPVAEPATVIFPRLNGMYVTCGGQIIASIHDGLSLLPVQVPCATINGVKVASDEQRKGICKALLHAFLAKLFASSKQRVGLFVDVNNVAAKTCYEAVGLVKKQLYYKVELERAKSSS
jgi:ribosomal protein S18 acetylase RimI-like enzyme